MLAWRPIGSSFASGNSESIVSDKNHTTIRFPVIPGPSRTIASLFHAPDRTDAFELIPGSSDGVSKRERAPISEGWRHLEPQEKATECLLVPCKRPHKVEQHYSHRQEYERESKNIVSWHVVVAYEMPRKMPCPRALNPQREQSSDCRYEANDKQEI